MEYIVGLIILVLGGGFIYFKSKAEKARVDAMLARTRGEDKQLRKRQKDLQRKSKKLDKDIQNIKRERKKRRELRLKKTKEQRAQDWKKQ